MQNEENIKQNKSSISRASSPNEMGEFWNKHSLTDYWDLTEPVFEVNLESENFYYKVDLNMADQINLLAQQKGVSPGDLINTWVKEKLQSEIT